MRIPDFTLHQPVTIEEAVGLAKELESSDFLSGGTDLLPNYKWGLGCRKNVISLRHIPELSEAPLGAGRTLWEIENDPMLGGQLPALVAAASGVATPLIRRSATLGGNLFLDTRCWHFNQTADWRRAHGSCLKAEADQCRVLPDPGDICVATYSGDLAPVLLAYGATAFLAGPRGDRSVPLAELWAPDGIRRFKDVAGEEFVVRVEMAPDAGEWTVAYQKLRLRESFDFPEGGVAAGVRWQGGKAAEVRIATTAYASVPSLHPEIAEILVGGSLEENAIEKASKALQAEVRPMKNTSMSPAYRKKMARVLCRRALLACRQD
jgi:4-hydroxybenzoyl-CoA reductase subunit beta